MRRWGHLGRSVLAVRWLGLAVLVGFVVTAGVPSRAADSLPTTAVVIETASGVEHLFRAEVAATQESRARGLMFREHMDRDAGMLFLFDPPQRTAFWMKNTLISLDMLFIDGSGRIVAIVERAEPLSERSLSPPIAVDAVLEINGGLSDALGITVGDRVRSSAFAD